jgi:hypothetical protein
MTEPQVPLPPEQPPDGEPFNPLAMEHLAESIGNALVSAPAIRADNVRPFPGAGVYAIFYAGSSAPYEMLGHANADIAEGMVGWPIYVGKAVPEGSRRGLNVATATNKLSERLLGDHRKSIAQAENLSITDFYFRWLIVEQIWIPLGESILIQRYSPVWNAVLDGFGNHAPGSGRVSGVLSLWDTLHPGRYSIPRGQTEPVYWARQYPPNPRTPEAVAASVREHLNRTLPI